MGWLIGDLSIEVRALLNEERSIPAVPAATRARAIQRARQAQSTAVQTAVVASSAPGVLPIWVVAGLACSISVAAGVVASVLVTRERSGPTVAVAPAAEPVSAGDPQGPGSTAGAPAVQLPSSPASSGVELERERDELRLLERAYAALRREDFAAAISPLMEHARRFKQGRLAEQREVLRMKALSGLGRQEEVRRAAAAFEVRFPRSPLMPVVQQMASAERRTPLSR